MEQVTLSSQPIYLHDGQTLYVQNNNQNVNLSACLNGDILQQALNGLSAQILNQTQPDLNTLKDSSLQNCFVLDQDQAEEEERVVQLSISDDFPLHLLNSSKSDQNILNTNQQSFLFENILLADNEKSDNSLSADSFNSLLQLSPDSSSKNVFDISPPQLKGNVTYTYQLTNGSKLNQVVQNSGLTVPVTASGNFSSSNLQTKANAESGIQVPIEKQNPGTIFVLGGVNVKPKLVLNLKNQTVQDSKSNIQIVQPVPQKNNANKNPRTIAPQRLPLPPLKKPKAKEIPLQNQNVIQVQQLQDLKSNPLATSLLLNTLLKSIPAENHQVPANKTANEQVLRTPSDSTTVAVQKTLLSELPSSPNVIKPDQKGKSTARLTEAQLQKISAAFQNGELNLNSQNSTSTIFDKESNTKIICRVVNPEDLAKSQVKEGDATKRKKLRGRPVLKKRPLLKAKSIELPSLNESKKPKGKKQSKQGSLARTRSGRLSRPPRYMVKDFKKVNTECSDYSDYESDGDRSTENSPLSTENSPFVHFPDIDSLGKKHFKKKNTCPTCNKSYPGKKMIMHFTKYPDHGDPITLFNMREDEEKEKPVRINSWRKYFVRRRGPRHKLDSPRLKELLDTCTDDVLLPAIEDRVPKLMSPWDYLVRRQADSGGAVRGLLSDLDNVLKTIPDNMLQKTNPDDPNAIQITDERLCRVLNISPGYYLPNDSTIKPPKENDQTQHQETPMEMDSIGLEGEDSLKDGVPLDLDQKDTELSEILLDKSLDTVDEILNERLNDLMPLDVPLLAETQELARSIFSTNSLGLHNVSASTEDLLISLENLTPELPPVSVPADFDFTVLSTDFGTDR